MAELLLHGFLSYILDFEQPLFGLVQTLLSLAQN